ncbi:hypothetical protein FGG08_007074 [Glutinoglossum americanum]|uniref:G-patch domain-containing protein n=1 Tax=Glutinoglossum americanum TaxID=1670608 RepID=A0A9P8I019_9PEZI|nr:hypothetical protein FGG08_007074 [Glutinoglossum americanum]
MANNEDDDEYFIPLQDQRVFGAGLKRKRVHFVPATENGPQASPPKPETPSIQDYYLSIVLPNTKSTPSPNNKQSPTTCSSSDNPPTLDPPLCPTCHLPLPSAPQKPHESTLPHQLSLPHSHPPSSLPRQHIGLQYLCAHGWDPDSRSGLGARGEGVRFPVKVRWKGDTVGLGIKGGEKVGGGVARKGGKVKKKEKLGAKEVRKLEEEGRRRGERLKNTLYGRVDVEEYLASGKE